MEQDCMRWQDTRPLDFCSTCFGILEQDCMRQQDTLGLSTVVQCVSAFYGYVFTPLSCYFPAVFLLFSFLYSHTSILPIDNISYLSTIEHTRRGQSSQLEYALMCWIVKPPQGNTRQTAPAYENLLFFSSAAALCCAGAFCCTTYLNTYCPFPA